MTARFFEISNPGFLYNSETHRGWRGPYLQQELLVQNTDSTMVGLFPRATDKRTSADSTFADRGFFPSTAIYGIVGNRAVGDQWGNPIVLQVPPASSFPTTPSDEVRLRFARIVSAGPDGVITTPLTPLAGMKLVSGVIDTTQRGDDIIIYIQRTDVYEAPYATP